MTGRRWPFVPAARTYLAQVFHVPALVEADQFIGQRQPEVPHAVQRFDFPGFRLSRVQDAGGTRSQRQRRNARHHHGRGPHAVRPSGRYRLG